MLAPQIVIFPVPVPPIGLSFVEITAGQNSTFTLLSDGPIWPADFSQHALPAGLTYVEVAVGGYHTIQGGTPCIAAPIRRAVRLNSGGSVLPKSDCSGVCAIDFNAIAIGSLGGNPQAELQIPDTTVGSRSRFRGVEQPDTN
jgi:hypothetical protein